MRTKMKLAAKYRVQKCIFFAKWELYPNYFLRNKFIINEIKKVEAPQFCIGNLELENDFVPQLMIFIFLNHSLADGIISLNTKQSKVESFKFMVCWRHK